MTTKSAAAVHPPVAVGDYTDENGVFYPETDGEPLPDGFDQEYLFQQVMPVLRQYLKSHYDVIVSGDTFIYYEKGNPQARVAPDCYVAFGVTNEAIRPYNSYLTWHIGKVPDFALEIASKGTARQDLVDKRVLYAEIGIGEYWRYDATLDSEFYGEPLVGERLVDGQYVRLPLEVRPDGQVRGHSPVLGMDLCWDDGRLFFCDPVTGEYLMDLEEAEAARQAAEAEVAQLREQLRVLREEGEG